MSKYGFNPDEVVTTKIDLIDKDGFHGVGTADSGGSGEGGENSGGGETASGLLQSRVYSYISSNDDALKDNTLVILYDKDLESHIDTFGWIFVYLGETKNLKREYESWDEFVEDVGYDFSEDYEQDLYQKYQIGEAASMGQIDANYPLYYVNGFDIYGESNADAIDALDDKTINAIGIYGYDDVIVENGYATCKPTGSFRVIQASGQFMNNPYAD